MKLKKTISFFLVLCMIFALLPVMAGATDTAQKPKGVILGGESSLPGDVDGDGDVDIFDANLVASYYNEQIELTEEQLEAADVNYDGEVDIFDANLVAAYYNEHVDDLEAPVTVTLHTSKVDYTAGEYGELYFYAEVTGEVEYVYLMDGNGDVVMELLDDGKYSYSGDDLPGDNIYSGVMWVDTYEEAIYSFYAMADGEICSETIQISILAGFTQEELEQMEQVDLTIQEDIFEAEGYTSMTADERAELAGTVLDVMAEDNLVDGESVVYDESAYTYTFQYSCSALGAVVLKDWEAPADAPEYDDILPEKPDDVQTDLGDAVILWSFNQAWDSYHYRGPFYQAFADELTALGLDTTVIWGATVEDYKELEDYEVIMVSGHGEFARFSVKTGFLSKETKTLPSLLLSEHSTREKDNSYEKDLKAFRVGKISVCGGTMYAILPDFFTNYYSGGALDGSFVFMENCETFGKQGKVDYTMAEALTNVSAEAVVGYHNSVMATYCRNFMRTYVLELVDGQTAKDAFNQAVATHGANDGYGACPILYGDKAAELVRSGLRNGNFEEASTPVGWDQAGDVRVLTQLGELSPVSKKRMAILTTGIGSAEDDYVSGTEGSVLSQTFRLSEDATVLSFAYDVVSEEPMEYVGSRYNDTFLARLTVDGLTYLLVEETINGATWHKIDGIDFDGGDETTYHTQWMGVEFDISAFAGKMVTLEFVVYDVGDSAYDTAALIDNIRIQ